MKNGDKVRFIDKPHNQYDVGIGNVAVVTYADPRDGHHIVSEPVWVKVKELGYQGNCLVDKKCLEVMEQDIREGDLVKIIGSNKTREEENEHLIDLGAICQVDLVDRPSKKVVGTAGVSGDEYYLYKVTVLNSGETQGNTWAYVHEDDLRLYKKRHEPSKKEIWDEIQSMKEEL